MASVSSMAPICEIVAASISPDELDFKLDPDSKNTMNEFEVAWRKFMKDNPDMVPEGKRERNIKSLQRIAKELRDHQLDASDEFQAQLDAFEKNRETMEAGFEKELNDARTKQKATVDNLQRQRDNIPVSEYLLGQAIPFEHFVTSLEKLADTTGTEDVQETPGAADKDKKAKPSARALFLANGKNKSADNHDVQFRAYHIDNALLNSQVKMLQKEAEGYEKYLETQETIGGFLKENKGSTTKSVGAASVGTKSVGTKSRKSTTN